MCSGFRDCICGARQLSGRMPDSQSSEPEFESPFATVSKIGHFRSLHWRPGWLSCINEYLVIDSGGNVSDLAVARNCCMARMLPGEAELVSEWTGLSVRAKSVQHFERSNGLDTALYKVGLVRSNAARRYDDGCHVSRPLCLLHARSWLRMPMWLLHVLPQCRHMQASCDADDVALRAAWRWGYMKSIFLFW